MQNRRNFLKTSIGSAALLSAGHLPFEAFSKDNSLKITILHTNDVHSRIEAFPMDGSRNQGLGGIAARAELIKKIRAEERNVLLLDAGDIFQGTPYFNYFQGELEMKLMSELGYDAGTIGNHDFDAGIEGLDAQLPNAQFPLLNANYDFSDTVLSGKINSHKIFKKDEIKIGVFGLGIELDGLVPKKLIGETRYSDPISAANKIGEILKFDYNCNLVLCLSHLGYKYKEDKVSDEVLARQSRNIDLILGGHTHTFFSYPKEYKNANGKKILINQVGWAGLMLGRIDYFFKNVKEKTVVRRSPMKIRKKGRG